MEEQPSAGLDLSGVGALLGGAPLPSSCTLHCVRACAVAAANLTTTTTVDITTIVHLKAPECHPCVGGGEVFDDHLHHLPSWRPTAPRRPGWLGNHVGGSGAIVAIVAIVHLGD